MSGKFNPGFYGSPGLGIARPTSPAGIGGTTPVPGATDLVFDNTTAGLPGSPDTVQEAVDALAVLWGAGFPRPLMTEDPVSAIWQVVVDGDGNAIMVTG